MEVKFDVEEFNNGVHETVGFEISIDGDVLTVGPGKYAGITYDDSLTIAIERPGTKPDGVEWLMDIRSYAVYLLRDGTILCEQTEGDFVSYQGEGDKEAMTRLADFDVPRDGDVMVRQYRFTLDKSKTE